MLKVPYDSDLPMVKYCLAQKQYDAKHTFGRGPHSCSALVEYVKNGYTFYKYGNSQAKAEVGVLDKYKDDSIKCHGESNAIAAAIGSISYDVGSEVDLGGLITKVYVELSPCLARCAAFLKNASPKLEIMYSFDHPGEIEAWKKAASKLCSGEDIKL